MNQQLFSKKKLKCVLICGGKGKRLLPLTENMPKSLVPINEKPILWHIVEYLKQYTNDFMFIFEKGNEGLAEYIKELNVNSLCIIEGEPKGIANAILFAKNFVSDVDNFIVGLGDCIYKGDFNFTNNLEQGFGIIKTDNIDHIKRSYSVEIENGIVKRVVEKPKNITNNLCGMGFYLFNKKFFDYVKITKPSELTKKVEITDVIQKMIDSGEVVKPIFFNGKYLNITYPEDIKKAEEILS